MYFLKFIIEIKIWSEIKMRKSYQLLAGKRWFEKKVKKVKEQEKKAGWLLLFLIMKKAAKKSKIACAVELLKKVKRAGAKRAKKVTFFSNIE